MGTVSHEHGPKHTIPKLTTYAANRPANDARTENFSTRCFRRFKFFLLQAAAQKRLFHFTSHICPSGRLVNQKPDSLAGFFSRRRAYSCPTNASAVPRNRCAANGWNLRRSREIRGAIKEDFRLMIDTGGNMHARFQAIGFPAAPSPRKKDKKKTQW
jgi:hypothetical protein